MIRKLSRVGGNVPPSYEVEYKYSSSLLVPVAATETYLLEANRLKLIIESIRDLVSVSECLDSHDHSSKRSLDDTVSGIAASDHQGDRRGSDGGRS